MQTSTSPGQPYAAQNGTKSIEESAKGTLHLTRQVYSLNNNKPPSSTDLRIKNSELNSDLGFKKSSAVIAQAMGTSCQIQK